jgi:hypothetical protein
LFKKQQREKVSNKGVSRTIEPFQLFHNGLCGPLNCPSFFGDRYFLTFVNDYNKKLGCFFSRKRVEHLTSSSTSKDLWKRKPMI